MKRMKIVVCCLFILCAAGLLAFSPGGHAQVGSVNDANTTPSICSVWPLPPPSKIGEEKYQNLLRRYIANPSDDEQQNYQALLNLYVSNDCYKQSGSPGRWQSDTQIRDTGIFILNKSLGTHNAVKVYYSGEVVDWLKKREALRTGMPAPTLPDGAMIIKEMYPSPAQQQLTDPRHKCTDASGPVGYGCTGLAIMVRDNGGVYDGWFWSDGSKTIDYTGYPNAGYGLYCINCHASAQTGLSFSSLNNINGNPIVFNSTMEPSFIFPGMRAREDRRPVASAGQAGHSRTKDDVPVHLKRDNKPDFPGDVLGMEPATAHPTPVSAPNPAPTPTPTPIPRQLVGEWYDWTPQRAGAQRQMFLTSTQCIGCHDATQNNAAMPNMIYPQVFVTPPQSAFGTTPTTREVDLNLSPYSEWRSSMMGLSGRDPVFFSQLETELNLYPGIKDQTVDTCLSCHGVMGERQIKIDTNNKEKIKLEYLDRIPPQPYAEYGALARDGVSCTVCHHITDKGLGQIDPTSPRDVVRFITDTGRFNLGPPDEIYGPYRQVATVPMKNSLGVTPLLKEQSKSAQIDTPAIKSSALCGTCHTVVLPVLDPSKTYTDRDDVFNKAFANKIETEHEQNTYIEWLNSDFQNEAKIARRPVKAQLAQSCQDCHMPTKYPSKTGADLQFKIASIEDDTFPAAENISPNEDLHMRTRGGPRSEDKYSRHTLLGLNLFVMDMFEQFPVQLGISNTKNAAGNLTAFYDPMATWGNPVPSSVLAKKAALDFARNETAKVEITSLTRTTQGTLKADVKVTNLVGHKFPSGVSFRRAFIEFRVNVDGKTVWASGATNDCSDPKQRVEPVPCGVIGVFDQAGNFRPLPTEFFDSQPGDRPQVYQPHYEKITQQEQVQIYEELVKDARDRFTTSFLSLKTPVKDNRLMPLGWNPNNFFAADTRPHGEAARDPLYLDGSGTDVVTYEVPVNARPGQQVTATATIYYQTIPPYYLQQRYMNSPNGVYTQSLKWYVDNLKTDINKNIYNNPGSGWDLLLDEAPIKNWKLMIGTASRRL